ncbi:MAG TPA: methyltransferase domain-containing protein [Chthoniobacterales bacterium]|nr:methyltransferase domain-containing protein [Chthoniobacterales bacterium]
MKTFAVDACAAGRYVLQFGSGNADVTAQLKRKLCHVTAIGLDGSARRRKSKSFISAPRLPENVAWFDQILLMDLIEHLRDPKRFMAYLRRKMARRGSEVIITASNIGSFATRLLRRLGGVSNGEITRPRAVTFKSLWALLEQTGYEVVETRGLPAPFQLAIGDNRWSRALVKANQLLLTISKHFFSHQICIRARPLREARSLAEQPISESVPLQPQVLSRVA